MALSTDAAEAAILVAVLSDSCLIIVIASETAFSILNATLSNITQYSKQSTDNTSPNEK
jgi:hypothetical protein